MPLTPETGLLLALGLPWLGALGVLAAGRRPNLRDGFSSGMTLCTFAAVACLVPAVSAGARPAWTGPELLPGLAIAFEVEPLGLLFGLVASGLWIATAIYAVGYMRGHHEERQTRFFTCFALSIAAALGIAFSANLATLFLFYEFLTFATYPLVTHHGTPAAVRAGRVYLGVLVSTSVLFLLPAIVWTAMQVGHLDFRPGGILAGHVGRDTACALFVLFMLGVGKAAIMPFHRWLPAAMVAPTPVSALLHAVAVVKAGVFTILKIVVYIFGLDLLRETDISVWLTWLASFTILAASVRAIAADNLKTRLAYSTVSQLSYIVLGAALATPSAVLGAGLHILVHGLAKITLFFCAGAIQVTAHKTQVSELDGLGRAMPFTLGAFCVGSLCIIGIPPLGGAWSKWFLLLGAAEAHQIVFLLVWLASSLLAVAYLMPVVVRAFFGEPPANAEPIGEAHWLMLLPLCATALGCVVVFFYADSVRKLLLPILAGGGG